MTKDLSNKLYGIKLLCILTIVLAHTPISYINDGIGKDVLSSFAMCGVPVFFLISGYFFSKTKRTLNEFWKSKLKTIIVPWMIAGVLNYSKRIITGNNSDLFEMIGFILGYKSFFYYLTILCILYLIFWKYKNNKTILYLSCLITIVVRYLINFSILSEVFNNNLNILKWIGFFALGIIFDKDDLFNKLFDYLENKTIILLFISILGIIISTIFNWAWIIEELSWFIIMIVLVSINNKKTQQLFSIIGKSSFSIYLYHQFLTTKVLTSNTQLNSLVCGIIRPIIIVLVLSLLFIAGYYISKKISKKLNDVYILVTGTRL